MPLSLGLTCDNTVNILRIPVQILGKNCVVRSVATGWTGLAELASDVKEEAMKMYTEQDGGGAGGDGAWHPQ